MRGGASIALPVLFIAPSVQLAFAEEGGRRQIEEVVVTAERRESTVSDTSISITAFTGEMLEDFGIRNQEDLQNLIPAAVIEPYDMSVRGVGRVNRALGGDPGIATYFNGVYSEDFGIASTEGGLFDVERIEVLRGPQGTLYGRNAVGGAINFISKAPSDQFEGEARVIMGDYDLQETYGVLSGPLIENRLSARATGTKRTRDGYYDDLSGNPDPGNYGDENYALSLRYTPTDTIEINTRGNERSYRRRMAGADAAGIINFVENGKSRTRDNQTYTFGYRAVDPNLACANAFVRTPTVATPGVIGGTGCAIAGMDVFQFTNPTNGSAVFAQQFVPGVDGANPTFNPFTSIAPGLGGDATNGFSTTDHPNYAWGTDLSRQRFAGLNGLDGNDLKTDTSGQQDEFFDQQANSTDITWEINDKFSVKYIFGYTDYFYDRTSDVDLTSNTNFDLQFYVSQETEYVSHELQFFTDPTDKLSITSGLFYYDAKITQRGDFYDSTGAQSRYANNFPYVALGFPAAPLGPKVDLFTAKGFGGRAAAGGPLPANCLPLGGGANPNGSNGVPFTYCFGGWSGDTGDRIPHGPQTTATAIEYQARTERYAFAAYTQGVYSFNENFALTVGVRWARDQLDGEETSFYYTESELIPAGFSPELGGTSVLSAFNQLLGYQGGPLCGLSIPNAACAGAAPGAILNPQRMLVAGLPASVSLWRELDRKDDDITWRVNLDWTPTGDDLVYLSATKGFRAGGFNLGNFSSNAKYSAESLIAYELGYKGTQLDGALQINSAIYFYDYENVQTFGQGQSIINPASTSTGIFSVPGAEIMGWDTDVIWLPTDQVMLGANFSYTHNEYTKDFLMIDGYQPDRPTSLFAAVDAKFNIKGNQMLRVPEMKGGAYAQYTIPMAANGRIETLVNWSWIDKVYFSPFENDEDSSPSYQRLDLRVSWIPQDENWLVAAFVNNVMDEIGIRQVSRLGEDENWRRSGAVSDPRLYGLEVRYKFGAFK
jgi:outer membrane receptor protein involved in Fe transport